MKTCLVWKCMYFRMKSHIWMNFEVPSGSRLCCGMLHEYVISVFIENTFFWKRDLLFFPLKHHVGKSECIHNYIEQRRYWHILIVKVNVCGADMTRLQGFGVFSVVEHYQDRFYQISQELEYYLVKFVLSVCSNDHIENIFSERLRWWLFIQYPQVTVTCHGHCYSWIDCRKPKVEIILTFSGWPIWYWFPVVCI